MVEMLVAWMAVKRVVRLDKRMDNKLVEQLVHYLAAQRVHLMVDRMVEYWADQRVETKVVTMVEKLVVE
jgi:hypothetical protein